jgi:hypothetical protein
MVFRIFPIPGGVVDDVLVDAAAAVPWVSGMDALKTVADDDRTR